MSAGSPSYDATTASLLASSEASFSFPTCFTRLAPPPFPLSRSLLSGRAHCPFIFSRFSVVSPPSFLLAFLLLCVFSSSVVARPHFPRTSSQHSSHTGPPTAPQLPTPAAVSPIIPPPPSVRISSLVRKRAFIVGVDFQSSRVTGLQATSPKRSPPHLTVVFFFQDTFFSLARPLSRRVRRPTILTQRWRRYSCMLSEASSSFPTCFTCLTHASTVPALAHPQVGVSTVRSPFLSFHFPFYHWHFNFSVCFRFVCYRPSSLFTNFKPHSSHITLGHLQNHCYLEQQQFHRSLLSRLLFVYLSRFERGFTVGLQSSPVTGLQAKSPERSPPSALRRFV